MTKEEAIQLAKSAADGEGWPWQEPVSVRAERTFILLGRRRWRIMTNANCRGGNVNIVIDDETGAVTSKGFAKY